MTKPEVMFSRWQSVPADVWSWPDFTPEEMACKHCGQLLMVREFMDALQSLRDELRRPLAVNSGYRCSDHPVEATRKAAGRIGPHQTGMAVDVKVMKEWAWFLQFSAMEHGFTGIGVCLRDGLPAYLHLDMAPSHQFPRPRLWSY